MRKLNNPLLANKQNTAIIIEIFLRKTLRIYVTDRQSLLITQKKVQRSTRQQNELMIPCFRPEIKLLAAILNRQNMGIDMSDILLSFLRTFGDIVITII